jgi:hypothetical protein
MSAGKKWIFGVAAACGDVGAQPFAQQLPRRLFCPKSERTPW